MTRSKQRRIDQRVEAAIRDLASKALDPNYSITQLLRDIISRFTNWLPGLNSMGKSRVERLWR
jgi:hypothetical protein